ncbi:hypothetical protein CYLTODRAFT_418937 [Cylindrobasidium torrendii FP15055 ss-10]|uniref:EamA domain-containing protein n=1 Tax=Cylindrobasidium torrendii FP15055 ss-10 TaxID=1314674 RepID=A0A0D7BMG7_9AGAR|nr:hypothetical protein CYLTODRAFT_418937 [Cylindrobasidium torrendii FP15055 ss-10]
MAHAYVPLAQAVYDLTDSDSSDELSLPPHSRPPFLIQKCREIVIRPFNWITKYVSPGLMLVTTAQAFAALMNVSVKTLNSTDPPVHTLQLIACRMGITYMFSVAYMISTGVNDPWVGPKGVRLLLWFRGFSGFFGVLGLYFSLKYLSVSDATVLTFLAPFLTGLSSAIFLGEPYTLREAGAGAFSFIGVTLIARPSFLFGTPALDVGSSSSDTIATPVDIPSVPGATVGMREVTPEERLWAVGIALVGVLGLTGAYTSIRAISTRAHALHSLASLALQSTLAASLGMLFTRTPFVMPVQLPVKHIGDLKWIALLLEIGIFGFFSQFLFTLGLQREKAARATLAVYTQVVFATLAERIFFHTVPDALSVLGTVIIVCSAGWSGAQKARTSIDEEGESIALEEGLLLGTQSPKVSTEGSPKTSEESKYEEQVEGSKAGGSALHRDGEHRAMVFKSTGESQEAIDISTTG